MYSISNLTSVADCNVLLIMAEKEKSDLAFKKLSEERLVSNYSNNAVEIDAFLQGVIAEIAALETILTVLPPGLARDYEEKRKVRLAYRKFLLENRKENYGAVVLLEKQLDLERVIKQLDEVDAFTLEVTTHRDTL